MKNNIELRRMLLNLGISSNMQGYHYILDAEKILDDQQIHTDMKFIYSKLAKKYDSKPSAIERSIRYGILKSFKEKEVLKVIYGGIPDNSVFLYDLYFNFDIIQSQIGRTK